MNTTRSFPGPYAALLYLVGCALRERTVDEAILTGTEPEALYRCAVHHSLAALVYSVLEQTSFLREAPAELCRKWQNDKEQAIRRALLMDAEWQEIRNAFEKRGIWYAPLKGMALQSLYPDYGLREMADYDLLIDVTRRADIREIMISRGYTLRPDELNHHDGYLKDNLYSFEFHVKPFGYSYQNNPAYFDKIGEHLIPSDEGDFSRRLPDEYFYLHLIAHAYMHYSVLGTGLRILPDIYVFLTAKGSHLDRSVIEAGLAATDLGSFEEDLRSLAYKLFDEPTSSPALTESEQQLCSALSSSGTYGSFTNMVECDLLSHAENGKITFSSRIRYLLKRLHPSDVYFTSLFKACCDHPRLIPLFRVYRVIKGPFVNGKRIITEIAATMRVKGTR